MGFDGAFLVRRCSEIELTGEAMEAIGDFYAELRSRADESALPVTVRTLETVIRLSTAAAKARLSKGAAPSNCPSPSISSLTANWGTFLGYLSMTLFAATAAHPPNWQSNFFLPAIKANLIYAESGFPLQETLHVLCEAWQT